MKLIGEVFDRDYIPNLISKHSRESIIHVDNARVPNGRKWQTLVKVKCGKSDGVSLGAAAFSGILEDVLITDLR